MPIPGTTKKERVKEKFDAVNVELSPAEMQEIEETLSHMDIVGMARGWCCAERTAGWRRCRSGRTDEDNSRLPVIICFPTWSGMWWERWTAQYWVLGMQRFLLYLAFTVFFAFAGSMIVNILVWTGFRHMGKLCPLRPLRRLFRIDSRQFWDTSFVFNRDYDWELPLVD